jgi:hypothetical protein
MGKLVDKFMRTGLDAKKYKKFVFPTYVKAGEPVGEYICDYVGKFMFELYYNNDDVFLIMPEDMRKKAFELLLYKWDYYHPNARYTKKGADRINAHIALYEQMRASEEFEAALKILEVKRRRERKEIARQMKLSALYDAEHGDEDMYNPPAKRDDDLDDEIPF